MFEGHADVTLMSIRSMSFTKDWTTVLGCEIVAFSNRGHFMAGTIATLTHVVVKVVFTNFSVCFLTLESFFFP